MPETIIDGQHYGGAMDGIKESDRVLGRNVTVDELPQAPLRFEDTNRVINQNKIYPNICTIVTMLGCVSDITGYQFTTEQIMEIVRAGEADPARPFDKTVGRWLHMAVDYVRRYCNDTLGMELSSIAVKVGSAEYWEALRKGYTVGTGHQGNRAYNQDRDDNGILNHGGISVNSSYGHANGHFHPKSTNLKLKQRDSYEGRPTNIYENQALESMIHSGRQFNRGFILFPLHIMETKALPTHTMRDQAPDPDSRDIIIAWETELSQAMEDGYTPMYTNYTSTHAITRMLIELAKIRSLGN